MIQIYSPTNENYDANGDMVLIPSECSVHVVLNGTWEATMTHPIDDEGRWAYIVEDAVIKLPSFNGEQLFRIKDIRKQDSGVTATMEPIFYDCTGDAFLMGVRPTNKTGQEALDIMLAVNERYSGESDIEDTATAYYEYKNLLEALCGDEEDNSFLQRWGGEILFDNFRVVINTTVGGDYGVTLRYGKNIPSGGLTEEVDTRDVVTRIYPKSFNGYTMTDDAYVDSPLIGNYPTIHAAVVEFENVKMSEDASDDDEENGITICETQDELDAALTTVCEAQFDAGIDQPTVTIEADMVMLQNSDLYKDYVALEEVSLGDTVHCRHSRLGITTDTRVIELTYNCITERVEPVVLGDPSYDYFSNVSSAVEKITSVVREDGSVIADKVAGFLDGTKASIYAQYNVAKKTDYLAILFENLDESSDLYGAMAMGTQGLMISKERTEDGKDWVWTTALTSEGLYTGIIVGKLIVGNTLWISNGNGSMTFDSNGLYIDTSNGGSVTISNGDDEQLYIDSDGNLVLNTSQLTSIVDSISGVSSTIWNLAEGTSDEWTEYAVTDKTNCTVAAYYSYNMNDRDLAAGDLIQVSLYAKFSDDFAASGTDTAGMYFQGNYNYGGSTWMSFSVTGGRMDDQLLAILNSDSREGYISTYITVTSAMIDGTYSGTWLYNFRFNYYVGSTASSWGSAINDSTTYTESQIQQLADSISLSVTSGSNGKASIVLSANGSTVGSGTVVSSARTAFANESTSITISAGTITFNSDTFVVNSSYFNVTSTGVITATSGTIGGWNITSSRIRSSSSIIIGGSEEGLLLINEPSNSKPWIHIQDSNGYTKFQVAYGGSISVNGKMTVYNGSTAGGYLGYMSGLTAYSDGSTSTTAGIALQSTDTGNYIIATTAGVRMQAGTGTFYIAENSFAYLYASSFIVAGGSVRVKNGNGLSALLSDGSAYNWLIRRGTDDYTYVGNSSNVTVIFGSTVYVNTTSYPTYIRGSTITVQGVMTSNSNIIVDKSSGTTHAQVTVKSNVSSGCLYANYNSGWGLYNNTLGVNLCSQNTSGVATFGNTTYVTYVYGSTVYSNKSITVSSDKRLKTDFCVLDGYDAVFDALRPLTFRYCSGGGIHWGLTYQDVVSALETAGLNVDDHELVTTYMDGESGETYGGIAYTELIALLIAQVQRLKKRVAVLEK